MQGLRIGLNVGFKRARSPRGQLPAHLPSNALRIGRPNAARGVMERQEHPVFAQIGGISLQILHPLGENLRVDMNVGILDWPVFAAPSVGMQINLLHASAAGLFGDRIKFLWAGGGNKHQRLITVKFFKFSQPLKRTFPGPRLLDRRLGQILIHPHIQQRLVFLVRIPGRIDGNTTQRIVLISMP